MCASVRSCVTVCHRVSSCVIVCQVHEASVRSPTCGFDVWFDNHYGIDMCGGENCWNIDDKRLAEGLYVDDLLEVRRNESASHKHGSARATTWKSPMGPFPTLSSAAL